jgi:hypothetical protein
VAIQNRSPYDHAFEALYLAYIAGLSAFGLLSRPFQSRLALKRPATPRFNMPFELGLAVAWQRFGEPAHTWCVFESRGWRAGKSLSDLSGTDVYVHGGTPAGIFHELCNALVLAHHQPSVAHMTTIYRKLRRGLPNLMKSASAKSAFEARVFADLIVVAKGLASRPAG